MRRVNLNLEFWDWHKAADRTYVSMMEKAHDHLVCKVRL
jgi:hypothetical protein